MGGRREFSGPLQRSHRGFKAFPATMPFMSRTRSPRPRTAPSHWLRSLALLSASVISAGTIGFPATAAGAQGSGGPGGLNVDKIESSVDPAVAVVNTTLAGGRGEAAGTGMVISSSGEILTNNHVIESSSSVRVQIGGKGRNYPADVLGYNVAEDVALLKVNGVSGLDTIKTDDTVTVGEPIVALGNAGGRGGSPDASPGAVRGMGQTIQVGDAGGSQTLRNLIRIDATLQPGDSGGPLVDADGQVVGMNTAASSGGRVRLRTSSSEGYAVPIKTAITVANQIRSGQGNGDTHVGDRAFLGVSITSLGQSGSRSGRSSRSSALVEDVQSNSPADDAGLQQGDTIVALAGKSITSLDDPTSALAPHHPRDKVDVGWVDENGDHHNAQVTLTSGPPAGVRPATAPPARRGGFAPSGRGGARGAWRVRRGGGRRGPVAPLAGGSPLAPRHAECREALRDTEGLSNASGMKAPGVEVPF